MCQIDFTINCEKHCGLKRERQKSQEESCHQETFEIKKRPWKEIGKSEKIHLQVIFQVSVGKLVLFKGKGNCKAVPANFLI